MVLRCFPIGKACAGVCSHTLQSPGAARKFPRYITLRSCFSQHNSRMTFCAFPLSSSLGLVACSSTSCMWGQAFASAASPQPSPATRQQNQALSVKFSKTKSGGICIFLVFTGCLTWAWDTFSLVCAGEDIKADVVRQESRGW